MALHLPPGRLKTLPPAAAALKAARRRQVQAEGSQYFATARDELRDEKQTG
jgi:hypothetical protein